jgi:hypothetical protein
MLSPASDDTRAPSAPRRADRGCDGHELLGVPRRPDARRETASPAAISHSTRSRRAQIQTRIEPPDRARDVGDRPHEHIAPTDVRELVDENEAAALARPSRVRRAGRRSSGGTVPATTGSRRLGGSSDLHGDGVLRASSHGALLPASRADDPARTRAACHRADDQRGGDHEPRGDDRAGRIGAADERTLAAGGPAVRSMFVESRAGARFRRGFVRGLVRENPTAPRALPPSTEGLSRRRPVPRSRRRASGPGPSGAWRPRRARSAGIRHETNGEHHGGTHRARE